MILCLFSQVRPIDPWKRERPGRAAHILPNHGDIAIKRDTETNEVFVVQEGPGPLSHASYPRRAAHSNTNFQGFSGCVQTFQLAPY